MVTEVKEKKNLKLGNWQVFLLEKLNQLYSKGELCDVSLKFNDNKSIKAHKVVLTACTPFFDNLPSSSSGVVLHMPQSMHAHHVRPIINFMYTGKLEFASEDQTSVFQAARHLGMTVLTELLNVQQKPTDGKKNLPRGAYKKYIHKHIPVPKPAVSVVSNPDSALAMPLSDSPPAALPGKKLPIWKKRTTGQLPDEFYRSVNKKPPPTPITEIPRPTRFEWPEEEILPDISLPPSITILDNFETLSYDSQIILKPVDDPKPVISEDSIDKMPMTVPVIQHGTKRGRISEIVQPHADDDDDYDDGHFETIHDLEDDDEEEQTPALEVKPAQHTPPKPILKTHEVSTPTPSKKVRFTFSTENESNVNSDTQIYTTPSVVPSPSPAVSTPQMSPQARSTALATVTTSGANTSVNHAKIINEILKKYPDLVKNNKNIKLKIQSGTPSGSPLPTSVVLDKDGKPQKKVQYVVLKSDFASVKKEIKNTVMGAENTTGPWFCMTCSNNVGPINFDTYYNYRKHLQEVHNERIDARICEHCGFRASKRNLHLYHLYTKHNIPPPRNINFPKCDQCNYIALSESLLIKHRSNHTGMLSKEYVCRLCNAAFKSNGALMGHMQTNLHHVDHPAKKNYECEYCGKIFNRNINLKAHIRTSHQEENRKMYDDEDKIEDPIEVEPSPLKRNDNVMEVIEVPVFDSVPAGNKTLYLPQGMTILAESPAVPLMPSSESEAMNNVATGIATSINITDRNIPNDVIVIDGNSDIILRGTPATYHLLNQDGSYSVQEYIVPEIMADSGGQVYTAALVSTAPTTGISYVNSDNISIITSGTDHTYADGMKINGHVNTTAQGSIVPSNGQTVITSQVQVSQPQATQPIIMQEPIIMSADWVQSIASSQAQSLNLGQGQKLEVISVPVSTQVNNRPQTSHQEDVEVETAEKLVSDWGDLEEDNQENSKDKDDESEVKPSRPTIELDVAAEIDM